MTAPTPTPLARLSRLRDLTAAAETALAAARQTGDHTTARELEPTVYAAFADLAVDLLADSNKIDAFLALTKVTEINPEYQAVIDDIERNVTTARDLATAHGEV